MLISVIVPVYKVEKYLHQCIDSILAQSVSDLELLLVDDGSPDGCGVICDEYAALDGRIKVFHTENRGVCAARNLAIEHAEGKYLYFVDSDDWIGPDRLKSLLDGMHEEGISFGGGTRVYEDGHCDNFAMPALPSCSGGNAACQSIMAELMRRERFGWVWCKLFSREIIREHHIEFHREYLPCDDEIFTAEYCQHITHISVCNNPEYFYRILPNTLSRRAGDPLVFSRFVVAILQKYQQIGYAEKILYIQAFIAFNRLRKLLRIETAFPEWCSAATLSVVEELKMAWGIYLKSFRWRYVLGGKEWKTATIRRVLYIPKSHRRLEWLIRRARL